MSQSVDTQHGTYTEADWENDSYSFFAERIDPPPCPECGRTGFFGPRALDGGRKFRACRFCGFFQEIGKSAVKLKPVTHDCEDWPEVARAAYVWWVTHDQRWFDCPFCQARIPIDGFNPFQKGAATKSPAENPDHPWWKIPQNRPYDYYQRFWENWEFTEGRVVL